MPNPFRPVANNKTVWKYVDSTINVSSFTGVVKWSAGSTSKMYFDLPTSEYKRLLKVTLTIKYLKSTDGNVEGWTPAASYVTGGTVVINGTSATTDLGGAFGPTSDATSLIGPSNVTKYFTNLGLQSIVLGGTTEGMAVVMVTVKSIVSK